jgi:hypothetical protein
MIESVESIYFFIEIENMNLIEFTMGTGILIILTLIALPILLWIAALVHCLKSDFENDGKIIWILVIVFLPILGSILYLLIGRNQKISLTKS